MYSDRVAAATGRKRSIKERLGSGADISVGYGGQSNLKRQRQSDEKWKHDLYDDEEEGEVPRISNGQSGMQDLRMKLQRNSHRKSPSGSESQTGLRDLREKLSGTTQSRPANTDAAQRIVSVVKGSSASKSVPASKPVTQSVPVPSKTIQKQPPPAEERSVGSLLQSLGLGKYLITFQAEEVDMAALRHMSDDDLKALGIPMGPRKKILLALESYSKR
uniref:TSA: Wollemia nobilis Ref_Wollemi_Transcript_11412_1373 transcribed RNA sequence n=1 Tax=Wollemia nobilis TaxID=56998 RepID=A0A0C9RV61_9CONI